MDSEKKLTAILKRLDALQDFSALFPEGIHHNEIVDGETNVAQCKITEISKVDAYFQARAFAALGSECELHTGKPAAVLLFY